MARYVLPAVGAVVGFAFGGPAGASLGWSLGAAAGGLVDPQIIKGPGVGDIAQQTSQEGVPRPIVFGLSQPIAGNIIASSEPRIVKNRKRAGKGGPKVETETVFRTYAIRICEGPISAVVRVWRNNQLVYDVSPNRTLPLIDSVMFLRKARFFLGTYTQNPSPDLEAIFGVGTTPAHRGTAYMVMADDDLTDLRGAIPQYTFQVSNQGGGGLNIYDVPGEYVWEKPEGVSQVSVVCIGGGGGGGSGALSSGGLNRTGGAGGGGGGYSEAVINASELSATETVIVGAGGLGGAPKETTGNGNSGASGGDSSFGAHLTAGGGEGGEFGRQGAGTFDGSKGGAGGVGNVSNGGDGADGNTGSGATIPDGSSSTRGGGGGGGGGSRDPAGTGPPSSGGAGNTIDPDNTHAGGVGPSVFGQDGGAGSSATTGVYRGGGGGGGGSTSPFNGGVYGENSGAGGDGGRFGGGGGGGGASTTTGKGEIAGGGGDGGDGVVVVSALAGSPTLRSVVSAICERGGLEPSMYDVTELDEDTLVVGLTLINTYPAYTALQALSQVFFFAPSYYDGVLHFVPAGGNSVATITEDDMVDDHENDVEQSLREDSIAAPRVMHLLYYDENGGLATDKQTSERAGDRRAQGEITLQSPVLMTSVQAARAVAINHKVSIEELRGSLRFCLPDNWLRLVPTNPVVVQWNGQSRRCRITKCEVLDGYQQYELFHDRQSAYTSEVEGIPAAPQTPPPSNVIGPTLIEPLDIHILRDADDNAGLIFYVAISGTQGAWTGALVELSLDGGQNYVSSVTSSIDSVMGSLESELPDHPQAFPDEVHTLAVHIQTPNAELDETDLTGLMNRQNLAIVGDELIQFANATETSEGHWELSLLLRGRKGTEPRAHAVGERFVLLDPGSLAVIPAGVVDIGRTFTFRATSFGETEDTATVVSMVYTGQSQREREPAYLRARLDGDDAIVSWQGVARLGSGAQVAHGARFVGYHVIFEGSGTGDVAIEVDTTETSITQDISSLNRPIRIAVSQVNSLTGRGPEIQVYV